MRLAAAGAPGVVRPVRARGRVPLARRVELLAALRGSARGGGGVGEEEEEQHQNGARGHEESLTDDMHCSHSTPHLMDEKCTPGSQAPARAFLLFLHLILHRLLILLVRIRLARLDSE